MADSKNANTATADGGEGSGARAGAWTEAERSQLLLRVLASVLPEGKGVDWKNVNMPGRTQKALQHQWTTVLAQIRDLNIGGDGTVTTPAKPRAARKKTPKKAAGAADGEGGDEANEGDEDGTPVKTPKKRGAASAGEGSAKKRRAPKKSTPKVEDEAEEEDGEAKAEENVEEEQ
ncbi:hypothetical protein CGCSCA5_v001381 [Colletotrichum siamense]|nr:hypothetical protein CGCSCA5_v001381 [Colletotrichum siamense]KAF4874916.1 hypothetical protein CGCSCA1_v005935 [Colletotrichum siamense]